MDYADEARYPEILAAASQRGIIVNTIQCGEMAQTALAWADIAKLGGGTYLQVEQAGNGVAIATPFDSDIAILSAELDGTRLYYGSPEVLAAAEVKVAATDKLHELASLESRARRAAFNASASGSANLFGENELVDDIEHGRVDLNAVSRSELPAPLQALDPDQRQAVVAGLIEKREELRKRIQELGSRRDAYLAEQVEAVGGAAGSLDEQIFEVVRDQAAAKGLDYSTGPKY
jgi:hypothetical protein